MAAYEVKLHKIGAYAKTLTANTADTVTFASEPPSIRVFTPDGTAPIYITVDGSTPTVGGEGTDELPGVAGAWIVIPVPNSRAKGAVAVKLISAAKTGYSVTRVSE